MNLSHIEHLGIAVKSLEEAIPFWENMLGLKCYNIEEVKEQKVRTAFFQIGQSKIELLESTDPEGPIGKFIEKMEVIDEKALKKQKYTIFTKEKDVYSFNYIVNSKSVRFIEVLFDYRLKLKYLIKVTE